MTKTVKIALVAETHSLLVAMERHDVTARAWCMPVSLLDFIHKFLVKD